VHGKLVRRELAVDEFRRRSTSSVETRAKRGGLNRAVWATGCPVWIADVPRRPRCNAANQRNKRDCVRRSHSRYSWAAILWCHGVFRADVRERDEKIGDCAHGKPNRSAKSFGRKQQKRHCRRQNDQAYHQAQQHKPLQR